MKISQTRNLRNVLIVLFCISTLLATTATSTVAASNSLGIHNIVAASGPNAVKQGFNTFDPTERAMPGNSRTAALPSATMLALSPAWNAIFPIIGLIAAVAVTQLLRRRRIAQLRSSSSTGQ